ncbi:hypothetical protein JTE90_006344 [Oedothorax gibbosus]|uniref:Cytochrome P450 n=1 Tax=Oedothorax gibbosus TaxID=931172 RepID=A0AAV6VVJ5_9ARAC|nr:hypothetical protein JTE90_006344 [Oedothorax gibbosus]
MWSIVQESFSISIVLWLCGLIVVLSYLAKWYRVRYRLVRLISQLPSLKLPFYQVFGHAWLAMNYRGFPWLLNRKLITSPNVYDFQALCGYNYLFSKENISNIWQIHLPFVCVYKADSVEMILNHSTELKKAWFYNLMDPWLGSGLLTSYDEKWRSRRKLLTPAFHFNILRDFLHVFNKQSKVLVDVLAGYTKQEFVDMVPLVTRCSLDIICESILGKELYSQTRAASPYVKAITELTHEILERMQSPWYWNDTLFRMSPSGRKFFRNIKVVDEFTMQVIAEKQHLKSERRSSADVTSSTNAVSDVNVGGRRKRALLDLLLDEQFENNSISVEDIREEVNTFTFEGHDTTSMSMSFALYMIGLHPWIQEKIHQELDSIFGKDNEREVTTDDIRDMKYLECVIKESLRIYPPVPAYGRLIRNDIEFQGRIVPKGSTCLVNSFILHRDPEVFPNPEVFDPDRFLPENSSGRHPFAYVPFSAGPRNCIGQKFALMEEKTVLSFILRRYKVRSLDPRDRVHLLEELVLRPLQGIRMQIRPRDQDFDFQTVYYRPAS